MALGYLKQLNADLDRWAADGLITPDTAATLRNDAAGRHERASPILPALAGLTAALGVLSIIAANWSALSGLGRLAIAYGLLALALIGAGYLRRRGLNLASNIAAAMGATFFGGALVVVGQLYHTEATTSAFLSAWAIGALAVTAALRAPLAAALTAGLVTAWIAAHWSESYDWRRNGDPFPPVFAALTLAVLFALAFSWRVLGVVHIAAIGAIYWLVAMVFALPSDEPILSLGIAVLFAALAVALETGLWALNRNMTEPAPRGWALRTLSGWAAWTSSAAFVIYVMAERFNAAGALVWMLAVIGFAVFSGLTAFGSAPGRRWFRGAGVAGFIGTAVVVFTLTQDLLTAGVLLLGVGGALTGLIVVSNRMLAAAKQEAAS